jgi:iron complex outermembrane recepter protein
MTVQGRSAFAALLLLGSAGLAAAQDKKPQDPKRDLTELSLEELIDLPVTTASRHEQRLQDVPAAVSVIRGDDIRRTGVRSLPDALRMVPGVQVANIDANKWAISIRGFQDRFSNKIQVLVDGRSVYSPTFSGVHWDTQDTFLEDVERIEVIRGPGGTVWGANAVNGVINIITKKAKDTQGGLVYAGAGTEERGFGGARYGGQAGDDVYYRAWAKYFNRDEAHKGDDEWWQARGGFRTEWAASDRTTLTLMGEIYEGKAGVSATYAAAPPVYQVLSDHPYDEEGGHLVALLDHRLSDTASLQLQVNYTDQVFKTDIFGERRQTLDFYLTHHFQLFEGNDVTWGAAYRWTQDDIREAFAVAMDPSSETDDVVSLFLQDEIRVVKDLLWLTLGCRVEHNDYVGLEYQPNARLSFRPHERHLFWAGYGRATRTPSRAEHDVRINAAVIPGAPDTYISVFGNDDLRSERIDAFELGWRMTPVDSLNLDLTGFHNRYHHLGSTEPAGAFLEFTPGPPHVVVAQEFGDKYDARTWGFEAAATWQVMKELRVYAAYTLLLMNLDPQSSSQDAGTENATERGNPTNQAYLRLTLDPVKDVEVDLIGRYVNSLGADETPSYIEADVRIGWRFTERAVLALVGTNLLHDEHKENPTSGLNEQFREIERGFYASVTFQF